MHMPLTILLQVVPPRPAAAPDQGAAPIYGYIPIVIFFLVAVLVPVALLGVSRLLQRRGLVGQKRVLFEFGVRCNLEDPQRLLCLVFIVWMRFLVFVVRDTF